MKKKKGSVSELRHDGLKRTFVCDGVDYGLSVEGSGVSVPFMWVCSALSEKGVSMAFAGMCLKVGAASLYSCLPLYFTVVTEECVYCVRVHRLLGLFGENDFDWSVGVKFGGREVECLLGVFDRHVHVIRRECFGAFVEAWCSLLDDDRVVLTEESLLWSRWEWDRLVLGSLSGCVASLRVRLWLLSLQYLSGCRRGDEYVVPETGFVLKDCGVLFTDHGEGFRRWASMFCMRDISQYSFAGDCFRFNGNVLEASLYGSYADRSSKGAYYTPAVWVSASQELLGRTFGSSWVDDYYIWDCAAGTGNLLQGLCGDRVFASTLESADVDVMCKRVDAGELSIPKDNIFQFDFLGGSWDMLPDALRAVVMDPVKRQRLIVYMNPPYVGSGDIRSFRGGRTVGSDRSVVYTNGFQRRVAQKWGCIPDLYVQFMLRCYEDLEGCKVGVFSPVTFVSNVSFANFRQLFKASYKGGFIVNSKTFDNVSSELPIAFTVWDMAHAGVGVGKELTFRVYEGSDAAGSCFDYTLSSGDTYDHLNGGLMSSRDSWGRVLGYLGTRSCVFFQDSMIYVHNRPDRGGFEITSLSLFAACVYFAVRLCHEWPWWLSREVYRRSYVWDADAVFKLDCLWFMQTSLQNYLEADLLGKGWDPFKEGTMIRHLRAMHYPHRDSFGIDMEIRGDEFDVISMEAYAACRALEKLYAYYAEVSGDTGATTYYAVRRYFQGVSDDRGVLSVSSSDAGYVVLQDAVKAANRALGDRIFEKVREYGFLSDWVCAWLEDNKI